MSKHSSPKMPLVHSLMWIVGSTFVISGSFHFGLNYFIHRKYLPSNKPSDFISFLIQTGPQKEVLRTEYLCQLMDLSKDKPKKVSSFDVKIAEKKLLTSPLIQEANVKVIKPSSVYVDYTVRQPVAKIHDFENLAIDKEGYPIPMYPFFPPKNLPEIFLGAECFPECLEGKLLIDWGKPIEGALAEISLDLLQKLQPFAKDLFKIRRIDVSKALDESLGKREIVVSLENELHIDLDQDPFSSIHLLRLSTKNYAKELGNYLELRKKVLEEEIISLRLELPSQRSFLKEKIIDLRIDQLAFIRD